MLSTILGSKQLYSSTSLTIHLLTLSDDFTSVATADVTHFVCWVKQLCTTMY